MTTETLRPTDLTRTHPPKDVNRAILSAESVQDNVKGVDLNRVHAPQGFIQSLLLGKKGQGPNVVPTESHYTPEPSQNNESVTRTPPIANDATLSNPLKPDTARWANNIRSQTNETGHSI